MKYFNLITIIFLLNGCLYFNDRGVSAHLYDNCHSYYDGDGNFIQECDENIVDYDEIKDGVVELKNEIKDDLKSIKLNPANESDTINSNNYKEIEENIEFIKSPCR